MSDLGDLTVGVMVDKDDLLFYLLYTLVENVQLLLSPDEILKKNFQKSQKIGILAYFQYLALILYSFLCKLRFHHLQGSLSFLIDEWEDLV